MQEGVIFSFNLDGNMVVNEALDQVSRFATSVTKRTNSKQFYA